jgi:hypothetical protein
LAPLDGASHNAGEEQRHAAGRAPQAVEEMMAEKIYEIPAEWQKRAYLDDAKYQDMYRRSIADPEVFWAEHGKRIAWMKPFRKVKNQMVRGWHHQRGV